MEKTTRLQASAKTLLMALLTVVMALAVAFAVPGVAYDAFAAEYSYQSGRDKYVYTDAGSLDVTFTVSYMEDGMKDGDGLIKWAVYLIDENTGIQYNENTHKYTDSVDRQRYVADYYFLLDPTGMNSEGTHTLSVPADAIAYHATASPSSATDYGTDTGKTLSDVIAEKNWIIGVGPMFENWWDAGYGAPIDYYVGRAEAIVGDTVSFYNYDKTLISTSNASSTSAITVPSYTTLDPAKYEFLGWYCDTKDRVYTTEQMTTLKVGDVVGSDKTVNFYAAYNDISGEYIEFEVEAGAPIVRYVDGNNLASEDKITVTYKMTHNDGFNSILLIPEFDTDVFAIDSDPYAVSVNNGTSLGASTITQGDGTMKILLENTGDKYEGLDGEDEFYLTVTYKIIAAVDGEYNFGLVLYSNEENGSSVAYYINEVNTQKGEQSRVAIKVVKKNTVTLVVKQEAVFEIGHNQEQNSDSLQTVYDYWFTYGGTSVTAQKVEELPEYEELVNNFKVYYTFNGDAQVGLVWYRVDQDGTIEKTIGGKTYNLSASDAPLVAGEYFVELSADATDKFYAAETKYGYVRVIEKTITVTLESKTSVYSEALAELTYTTNYAPFEGDAFYFTLTTDATATSPVGDYKIYGTIDPEHLQDNIGKYFFEFTGSWPETPNSYGKYTITKKALTITANNQNAEYTGSEPQVAQDAYTLSIEGLELENVAIAKQAGVNAGTYELTVVYENENYNLTLVPGTFTITSKSEETAAIEALFTALTKVYNGQTQNLLEVGTLPAYITEWSATNNEQKYVDTYDMTVTVKVDNNHNVGANDQKELVFIVEDGEITPAPVTIKANNVEVNYGEQPDVPGFNPQGTVYAGDELNIAHTVQDNGEAFTPSNTTPAGEYAIVFTASNPNYQISFVNGTYTVNKAAASMITIELTTADVYYNRDFQTAVTVKVNTAALEDSAYTITYYYQNQQAVTPENAGEYTVAVTVAETANYEAASKNGTFSILKVKLQGVEFTYDQSTASWTAVTKDLGKTADEEGVTPIDLKAGTTITYNVYDGETLIGAYNERQFTALAATTYKVVAVADNDNYLASESVMLPAYSVEFAQGEHPLNAQAPENMPETVYVFDGQSITVSETKPTLDGYVFLNWNDGEADYNAGAVYAPEGNAVLVAIWDQKGFIITFKYLDSSETEGEDMFVYNAYYSEAITYSTEDVVPEKATDNPGYYFTFANKWTYEDAEYGLTIDGTTATLSNVTVTGDMTFVAVYDINYNTFTVTYYFSENESTDYVQFGQAQEVVYNEVIPYRTYNGANYAWFTTDYWYADENRTLIVPDKMPAEDISVYGAYKFDIGQGDVNADGLVSADDITLYRQWIVGGYEMTEVEKGAEWDLVSGGNYSATTRYFLKRVADNNVDASKDIRDVSITRMAIVGGYDWDISIGETVTGASLERSKTVLNMTALTAGLANGRARMYADVTDTTANINVNAQGNVYLDLGGKTLTVKSFKVTSSGKGATVTVKNGTIITSDGITITAPKGNVVLENLTGYVGESQVNLQAAQSSLHFAGQVKFYKNQAEQEEDLVIVPVFVAEDTHIVVEENANLTVEKVVVATVENQEFVAAPDATVTLDNKTETEIVVEGGIETAVTDLQGLVAAAAAGGEFKLAADITYNGTLSFKNDTVMDLNGHTIRSMNKSAIAVTNGASLTINGNGHVTAQEMAALVLDGSTLTINGGIFTAYDNAVLGTNGSTNRGNNTITVNGGTFNGTIETAGYVACGIYVANNDTVVVNGGKFNITNGVGVLARSGNTTIGANATFNVTGDGTLGKVGDSKVTVPSGQALVVDLAANYPGGTPVLTNNNGKYTVSYVVDSAEELAQAAENGAYALLVKDVTIDSTLNLTGNFTLNGNGKTVTATHASGYYVFQVIEGGNTAINVEMNDLKIVSTGFQVAVMANCDYYSTTTLKNVDITCDGECVYINGHALATAENCEFNRSGKYAAGKDAVYYSALLVGYGGQLDVKDSTVVATGYGVSTFPSGGYITLTDTSVTVTVEEGLGQTAYALWSRNEDYNNFPEYETDSLITVKSGAIQGAFKVTDKYPEGNAKNIHAANIVIEGGTYTSDPTEYINKAKAYCEYANGVYTAVAYSNATDVEFAARIGNVGYATLAEAVNAATAGATVKVMDDIDLAAQVTVTKTLTLDMNGKTIANTTDIWSGDNWSLISVQGGELTITGNGKLLAKANDCYAADVRNGAKLVIENGRFVGNISAVYVHEGDLTVNGGEFSIIQKYSGEGEAKNRFMLNCLDANYKAGTATVTVNGGSFEGFNPANNLAEGAETNFLGEGYTATEENGVYTVEKQ